MLVKKSRKDIAIRFRKKYLIQHSYNKHGFPLVKLSKTDNIDNTVPKVKYNISFLFVELLHNITFAIYFEEEKNSTLARVILLNYIILYK